MSKFETFAALHVPGDPLVLFNIWDAGSARAVAKAGAKAIATGSASVAAANGFADGEELPMDFALANARRIVESVELPVTVDFEGGYAAEPEGVARNLALLKSTGAIGCNFEDQVVGGEGLYPVAEQAARIAAAREAVGPDFFINARTDLFLKAPMDSHDGAMVDEAIERARAYADAGASGFFVPLLADLKLLERMCAASPIPVNFMTFPGCPSKEQVAATGVARISHGPFPHRALMAQLEEMARAAIS
ncbi:MAG TPA: isocitrate lyase/phosphoenolpyruvate mutase family protein [Sphingomicrobium sp.]|nr:isocitrate lyase/phosphoenolpyruvate mutase family protein [Sphingomicrobium sp.]